MNYLYGDSTTSTLKSNFLEFLRDALDFSVFVLQADTKMKEGRVRIRALSEECEAEIGRLERFISTVIRAVDTGEKGKEDSPTAACGTRLVTLIGDAQKASIAAIRHDLSQAIARIEAEEAAQREECVIALGRLLAPHDPPETKSITRITLGESGAYEAKVEAKAEPALEWTLPMTIPDESAWTSPVQIGQLVPHLEIRAPQLAGWISKEVKIKPQKIESFVVTQLVEKDGSVKVELRAEVGSAIGFDFQVNPEKKTVTKAARTGPAEDQSVGPFELHADDAPLIVDLVAKIREATNAFVRSPKIAANFDGGDFRVLPTFVTFVDRLVAMMAPIVKEISARSLTSNELVLRRLLGNDRREEIFVTKATLRDKLAVLPAEGRALFDALGLEVATDKAKAAAAAPANEPVPVRSELPPSVPPPPTSVKVPPAPPSARLQPKPPPPTPKSDPGAASKAAAAQIEVVEEVDVSSDALLASLPPQSSANPIKSDGQPRNEALITALKKIVKLSKAGRAGDAYQEYETLFTSGTFAGYRAEDQRQALKLMVLAKTHPPEKEKVLAAHKAAVTRLKALLEAGAPDASDHELLGVAQLYLGDDKAARAAFEAGLEIERAKNPQSELAQSLTRRMSAL